MARKKGPSGSLEQVHFLTGQAFFKAYLLNGQNTGKSSSNKIINLGRIPLGWSGLRTAIWDHSDRGRLNEPMNPLGTRIHRFIWSIMIRWSQIADPETDHPKGMHPYNVGGQEVGLGMQNVRASCPKGKVEFKFFLQALTLLPIPFLDPGEE